MEGLHTLPSIGIFRTHLLSLSGLLIGFSYFLSFAIFSILPYLLLICDLCLNQFVTLNFLFTWPILRTRIEWHCSLSNSSRSPFLIHCTSIMKINFLVMVEDLVHALREELFSGHPCIHFNFFFIFCNTWRTKRLVIKLWALIITTC